MIKIVGLLEKAFPFITRTVKKRNKATGMANDHFYKLKKNIAEYGKTEEGVLLYQPVNYFKYIFSNGNFKMFVQYGFAAKKYQAILDRLLIIIVVICAAIGGLLYLISHSWLLATIIGLIILALALWALKALTKGETYAEFYKRTVYNLIYSIVPEFSIQDNASFSINEEYLKGIISKDFDHYTIDNNIIFNNELTDGEIFNLVLRKDHRDKNPDGTYSMHTSTVFDGFNIRLKYKKSFDFLKGAVINIRDDDNLLSTLAEDSVQSIHQSEREFMFNSEELNKSFDCNISGTNSFGDIDSLMEMIHRIITPSFEEHMLFLKKRFNTFNMTISDNMIDFNVSLSKSTFQKVKRGELLEFKSRYRDSIKSFSLPMCGSSKYHDFMFYKMFPPAEMIYYITYLDGLIRRYMDKDYANAINIETFKAFEETDLEIAEMYYGDFKKEYEDIIELMYVASKDAIISLGKEENNE